MVLKPGQYIRHAQYGFGTIVARDDERTTVDFDTAGVKKFVTSIATFEVAEGEPPKRKRAGSRRAGKSTARKSA